MENFVSHFFSQYAYSPWWVYSAICGFMFASAFGLPLPEEVVLVSAGLVGYMSLHPDKYPPPTPDAAHVNIYVLAGVALFAVLSSDYLIYWLGSHFGPRIIRMRWFSRLISPERFEKIQKWMWVYGYWTVIVFRFTPGIRFPGHLTCGAMRLSRWKFLAVDGIAATLTVPTQILLVGFYGQYIIETFARCRYYIIGGVAVAVIGYVVYKTMRRPAASMPATLESTETPAPRAQR